MLSPQPGTEIDGFRLGERMHVGTMAWIYRLMGPDGPLPLVMKMPRVGPTERPANIISFEVEPMVSGALAQSPHHPTLVAYGDVETTPYLVMEQVEGRRLREWIERAPIAAEETARLGHAFAMALHEVHRQDVIHLDLKSTNVLYRTSGAATLIDFGLSTHRHYPDLLAEELRFPVGNWSYIDRKSTRLNSSHLVISYAVFCLKKKKNKLHTNIAITYQNSYIYQPECAVT